MGLLAARRRPGRVSLRGSDKPGSDLLPGLHHPAALHDPRGPAGRLHRQGQNLQDALKAEHIRETSVRVWSLTWCVFVLQYAEDIKHKTTLLELQKMFTYLMVSSTFKPPAAPMNVSHKDEN